MAYHAFKQYYSSVSPEGDVVLHPANALRKTLNTVVFYEKEEKVCFFGTDKQVVFHLNFDEIKGIYVKKEKRISSG